jgi:hypothetical protein
MTERAPLSLQPTSLTRLLSPSTVRTSPANLPRPLGDTTELTGTQSSREEHVPRPPSPSDPGWSGSYFTHGANRASRKDRVVEEGGIWLEEEAVEKKFSQLWAVPKPDSPRVPHAPPCGGCLVWIRRDLLREKRVQPEDCYPAARGQRIEGIPVLLSFSREILARGKATYADMLKRSSMAEGGRWVSQSDTASQAPNRGGFAGQRGRGAGFQGRQGQQQRPPNRPPQPQLRQPVHQPVDPTHQQTQTKGKEKQVNSGLDFSAIEIDPRYRSMTCYNCGEPDHFVGNCSKPKVYFMCAIPGHYMTKCPKWKKAQPTTSYFGSAGKGLGFYHIDLPEMETTRWLNISNCGVVLIKKGTITMTELEKELSNIFCKEWPWQMRELTPNKFLVRFPPHRRVEDIKNLPSFNLRKEGVQVEVMEWIGDLDHFGQLTEDPKTMEVLCCKKLWS